MQEHEQGRSNVVPFLAPTMGACGVAVNAQESARPQKPRPFSGADQWQPLGVAVRRIMSRMFVEQCGEVHGKENFQWHCDT